MSSALRRAWLLTNIIVTVALLPALFADRDSGTGTVVAASAGSLDARPVVTIVSSPATIVVATTTTTVAPARKLSVAKATTTTAMPRPKPTSTTAAPVAEPAATAPPASGSESGRATWYDYKPGVCAHKTLPFGTVVTVNAVNGKSVRCTVGDRGPFVDGYVIDLHWQEFEKLAPRSQGRIDVTITW